MSDQAVKAECTNQKDRTFNRPFLRESPERSFSIGNNLYPFIILLQMCEQLVVLEVFPRYGIL